MDGDADEAQSPAPAIKPQAASGLRFERVELPKGMLTVLSVAGRNDRDVWLLSADGRVLRWDGSRLTSQGKPECYTDNCCGTLFDCKKNPSMCKAAAAATCMPFQERCAMAVSFDTIQVDATGVTVSTLVETGGMRGSLVESRLKSGRWSCEQGKEDFVYPGQRGRGDTGHALEMTLDGAQIRFEGPANLVNMYGGSNLTIDGRRVPMPPGTRALGFEARSLSDLWVWEWSPGQVWRGNGLDWYPVHVGLGAITDLWITEPNTAWILGARTQDEGTEELAQWDIEKRRATRYATPGAQSVLRRKDGQFYLFGSKMLYPWDGRELRAAPTPLSVLDAWWSETGALWLTGADLTAKLKISEEDVPAGAVFRLLPTGGK